MARTAGRMKLSVSLRGLVIGVRPYRADQAAQIHSLPRLWSAAPSCFTALPPRHHGTRRVCSCRGADLVRVETNVARDPWCLCVLVVKRIGRRPMVNPLRIGIL